MSQRLNWVCLSAVLASASCIIRQPKAADPKPEVAAPSISTRFARLTHEQWASSVRDLLGLSEAEIAQTLRTDPRPNGFMFDNYAAALAVDEALSRDYQRAAGEVAALATADATRLAQLLPSLPASDPKWAEAFVRSTGERAHRRPLDSDQVEGYLALWSRGRDVYPDSTEQAAGARLVLSAMLQSPHFLYRVVAGPADETGRIHLDGYELAARLSYALWNTLPDDALRARAASGALTDPAALRDLARGMLEDDRARRMVRAFHGQLFERERLARAEPSRDRFPMLSDEFALHAARESELFVEYQIFEEAAGFSALMTSSETFVNAELASIYGATGSFGEEFTRVTLDPARRKGLLSQVGFLAAHATSVDPDPIHRGVFIARRLLCRSLSAPGNLPPLPPAGGRTVRQTVEAHTEASGSGCAVCHQRTINPLGFPFEMYDAIGRERATDNGQPVDTRSAPVLDGVPVPVAHAVELAARLAESPSAHACYVRHWLEFAYGRPAVPSDTELIEQLGAASNAGELSIKDLVIELIAAPQFRSLHLRELL